MKVMKSKELTENNRILWIDNDIAYVRPYVNALRSEGYEVVLASTITDAKTALSKFEFDLVIIDIMIPTVSEEESLEYNAIETDFGHNIGLFLGLWIKNHYPHLPIIGCSARLDTEIRDNFMRFGAAFLTKYSIREIPVFLRHINVVLNAEFSQRGLKIFIVHGHDDKAKYELKNFIQNSLKLGEPSILHEQPSIGRTVIEKLEDEANDIDVVFVLLTPDDMGFASSTPDSVKRRARQNVIFELGYFLAKLERRRGRVLLLYKGDLDLPSDIFGLVYIDITNGIESAGEIIRRELADIL